MEYVLFSDIDENFSINLISNGEEVRVIHEHPHTKEKMNRDTALALAEELCNKKVPETKLQFFQSLQDDDFENFILGKSEIQSSVNSVGVTGLPENVKDTHILLLKMDMLPDFYFKEKEIKTLHEFCKRFDITAMPEVLED